MDTTAVVLIGASLRQELQQRRVPLLCVAEVATVRCSGDDVQLAARDRLMRALAAPRSFALKA